MIHVGIVIGDITKKAGTERAVTNLSNMLCESGKYHVWIISMYSSENDKPGYEIFNGVVRKDCCQIWFTDYDRNNPCDKLSAEFFQKKSKHCGM